MIWRRHRFWRFQNIQRSESEMVNAITKLTVQRPLTTRNVVIGFGDWEMRQHRKGRPPTKGKGLRAVLRVAGFLVFLVDEYRTSKLCSVCVLAGREGINKSDVSAKDPNAYRRTSYRLKKLKREMRHLRVYEGENSIKVQELKALIETKQLELIDCRQKAKNFPIHGLVHCQHPDCGIYWNRDFNSALNI
ncbi:hypothetical protein RCL1_000575 [Eukaryota sp. TZLM3-RCL]